jgi:hypothetical protein
LAPCPDACSSSRSPPCSSPPLPQSPGFSCCFKTETIKDPPPAPFDHRVDHVFTKGRLPVLAGRVVGDDPANRTASGLWPTDRGVVMTLRLR